MKLATILITLLLIGGFVTGFAGFYGALATQYSKSSHNFTTIVQSEEIAERVNTSMQTMKEAEQNKTIVSEIVAVVSAPLNLLYGAFNVGMLILQTPIYFYNIVNDLMVATDAPFWLQTMLFGIIGVIVLFAVVEFLTGRQTT
jgi:hypothetical protein